MITFAEIETELEKAGASRELSRSVARALELSQRKTATEVETNLKEWMENRFVTKQEFLEFKADIFKWMFIFWSSQILATAGMFFGFAKLLKP